jgi:hypothetical protein
MAPQSRHFDLARLAMTSCLIVVSAICCACTNGQCQHGSWGAKYGWQCHDDNDERGPQRDIPPEKDLAQSPRAAARETMRSVTGRSDPNANLTSIAPQQAARWQE